MTELTLAHRTFDGFERAFTEQAHAFRSRPDVAVRLESFDVPVLYRRMVEAGGCESGDYDLFLAVTDWLPELIRDGQLTALDDYLRDDPPPDWPTGWPDSLLRLQRGADGQVWGLPYHDGPEVLLYRSDLFAAEVEQQRFHKSHGRALRPPRTWSEFMEVARFFHRPEEGLYGCLVAAKPDGHNDVYDFLIHLWSRGGTLLDERGRPAFASAEGEEALRYYFSLIHEERVTQPEPWRDDSVSAGEAFAAGKAAMMWNWIGFQTVADLPSSAIAGLARSTMLPGGDGPYGEAVSLIVYWVLTIPVGSRHQDDAWAFLRHVATPEMDRVTATAGGSAVRLSTWNDDSVRGRFGGYEVMEEIHRRARTLPAIPEYPAINDVLDQMMKQVVVEGGAIAPTLRAASEEVAAIVAETDGAIK